MHEKDAHESVFDSGKQLLICEPLEGSGTCLFIFEYHVGLLDRKVNMMNFWKFLTCPLMVSVVKRSEVMGV